MLSECKYPIIVQGHTYYCCKVEDNYPPLVCPNIKECLVYKKMNKQDD